MYVTSCKRQDAKGIVLLQVKAKFSAHFEQFEPITTMDGGKSNLDQVCNTAHD